MRCSGEIASFSIFSGAFEDDNVTHVEGDVDPVRDLEIISEELRLKDLQYLTSKIVRKEGAVEPLSLALFLLYSSSSLLSFLSFPFSLLFYFISPFFLLLLLASVWT